jgi:hypothetical protein
LRIALKGLTLGTPEGFIFELTILFREYFGSYSCYKGKWARYKSSWDLYLIRKIENIFGILQGLRGERYIEISLEKFIFSLCMEKLDKGTIRFLQLIVMKIWKKVYY